MSTARPQMTDRDIFDVTEAAQILWARRWRMAALSGLFMLLGLLVALSLSNAYKSYAQIRVENPSPISTGLAALPMLGGGSEPVETEISVLKSRKILGEVIDRLNLRFTARPDEPPLYRRLPVLGSMFSDPAAPPAQITVAKEDIPDIWQGKDIELTYEGGNTFTLRLPDKTRLTGKVGQPIALTGAGPAFSLTVSALSGEKGQGFTLRKDRVFSTFSWLEKNLDVNRVRRTELVSLSMTDFSASRAQDILATTLEIYSRFNHDYTVEKAQRRLDHVEKELPLAMKAIDDAEEALNSFQKQTKTINVQIQTEYLLKRLAENEELLRTDQRPTERARLENIRDEIMRSLNEIPDTQLQMQNLQRDIEIAQEIYIGLTKVVQEQRIQRASAYGTVRILDVPLANELPVARSRSIIVLGIWLLGTFLTAVVMVARNSRKRSPQVEDVA